MLLFGAFIYENRREKTGCKNLNEIGYEAKYVEEFGCYVKKCGQWKAFKLNGMCFKDECFKK